MKTFEEIRNNHRLQSYQEGFDGGNGWIHHPLFKKPMAVVYSNGMGWNHVSVSFSNRTPTWDEMCIVKDMFFNEDETVIQYHPAKEDYVNNHPHTLHLWQPQDIEIPNPPSILV